MPTFPQWGVATGVVALGVWIVSQYDTRASWYLVVVILLGVLIFRDPALAHLNALITQIFGNQPG
jgi:hypothetical protein